MALLQLTKAEAVLREIESRSEKQFLPIIGPLKGKLLAELVQKHRPQRVVEVGTLVGYSAVLMGMYLPSDSSIVTLEIDPGLAQTARENIRRAGLTSRVKVLVGDAIKTIPTLSGPFGFAFLDAAKDEYLDYLKLLEPKLSPGTVVVADNAGMFAKAMAPYLRYVRSSPLYESRYNDFGFDGVEVSIKIS